MQDFSPILKHIEPYITLDEKERALFISVLLVKNVKRKQFLDQPGFISTNRNFVVKGAFRSYVMGHDGQEHTIGLAIEGSFIGDHGSFISQEPASMFVEALEDGIVIQLSCEGEKLLVDRMPKFNSFLRERALHTSVAIQKRLLSNISKSAENRYEEFKTEFPQYLQRFPLYMIASYLGMTREFLSKIRNKKS